VIFLFFKNLILSYSLRYTSPISDYGKLASALSVGQTAVYFVDRMTKLCGFEITNLQTPFLLHSIPVHRRPSL